MSTNDNLILESSDKQISQQQEIADLKIQLNATQQTIATLELKVRQKEEVIIKTQAESLKQEQLYHTEIKKLKEQLNESNKILESTSTHELQQALKVAEEKENRAVNELQDKMQKDQKMNQVLEDYERTISTHVADYKKLSDLHETVKGNLATLEMAFHDVIQKYERAKTVIEGFKANEEIFKDNIELMEKNLSMETQRYESLKAHASKQIEKANKDNNLLKGQCETLELKQHAIIKRVDIKIAALENALEQKNKECEELAALCDEVTGKKV